MFQAAGFIPVPPGARPGFDHADVYASAHGASRMYVAHTGADRVDVFDCLRQTYLRALPDHPGVAGVLVDSERGLLLTTDRGCARITIYHCADESLLGRIEVGRHPNAIAYDPARRHAFVFNLGEPIGESCTASVVSLDTLQVVATIPLPGRPRWALYEPKGDRVFANIREPAEIMVIEAKTFKAIAVFDVPAAGPHGLVLTGDHLICAADAGELIAMERDDGRIVGTAALPGEPDVVMYDAAADQLFVAVGDPGGVVVIDRPTLHVKSILQTERGAHTIGWDPGTRTLYAFLPARCGALVYSEKEG